jgi:APA family basic amino acid/polyamine antiporter
VDLGIIASLTTVSLITLLAQIRIFYAMANDGLLPPFFARIRSETPWISTILSGISYLTILTKINSCFILGIFCAVFAGFFPVDLVGETTSITAAITYIFVHIEVIVVSFDRSFLDFCQLKAF